MACREAPTNAGEKDATVKSVVIRVRLLETWGVTTKEDLVIGGGGTKGEAWAALGGVDLRSDLLGEGAGEDTGGERGVSFLKGSFLEAGYLELGEEPIILFQPVLAGGFLVKVELAF